MRPVKVDVPPLPVLLEGDLAEVKADLTLVGCLPATGGPVVNLGLVPSSTLTEGRLSNDVLCDSLPKLPKRTGGELAGPAWAQASSELDEQFAACRADLLAGPDASNSTPIIGPEAVSGAFGLFVGIASGLTDYVQKMSPEEKIAAGAALLLVVTLGALAVAFPAAAPALITVAEETASVGIVWIGTGVYEKSQEKAPAPGGGGSPAPSSGGSKPDPNAQQAPESCLSTLARLAACAGTSSSCEDPELAAALAAIRDHECRTTQVLVGPDDVGHCGGQELSDEQKAEALVGICTVMWSNRKPGPDQQVLCPLVTGLEGGPLESPMKKICERVLDATICPGLGDPPVPEPPACPLGQGDPGQCGPVPPGPERPEGLPDR